MLSNDLDGLSQGTFVARQPCTEEIMLDTLASYKEPGLKELTDGSFKHKTQAASACDVVDPAGHVADHVPGRVGDGGEPGSY